MELLLCMFTPSGFLIPAACRGHQGSCQDGQCLVTPSAEPPSLSCLLPMPCTPHTLSSRTGAEIAALATLRASLAGGSAVGIDHCGLISHPNFFSHYQIMGWFSAVPCNPIQKCISAVVIHLEIHFFRNLSIIQPWMIYPFNIQPPTSILKVFWKC